MKKLCFLLLLFALLIPSATAQDDISNLMDVLATVPDTIINRESFIGYVDFRAMERARQGAVSPNSWTDFMSMGDTLESELYMAALMGIRSVSFLNGIFPNGELWKQTIGFDFYTIDHTIYYGEIPEDGITLVGDFDTDAIADAFTARSYTSEPLGDFLLWCGEVGCENGLQIDINNRNLGNPFGGDFGQSQPILVSDHMIISAPALQTLIFTENAVTDKRDSLADNLTYIASINSINPDNIIIQASFVYFTQIVPNVVIDVNNSDVSELEELMAELSKLPQYELVMIADTATDTEQVVYVMLVYSALEEAESAIEIIPARLASMDSVLAKRPFQDLLDDRGVTEITATAVLDDTTNKALAIFEFHAPLASSAEEDRGDLGFVASSMVYRLFIDMVYSRDTDWLVAGIDGS